MNEVRGASTERSDDSSTDEVVSDAPTKPGKQFGRRFFRWGGILVAVVLLLIGFLSATAPGQRVFVNQVLARIQEQLVGELRIQGIRSGTLFTGATLTGVELDAEHGVHVLSADSIRVYYSPLSWVTSDLRVSSIMAWGLEFDISRLESGQALNIKQIAKQSLEGDEADSATEATRRPIYVGRLAVREGLLRILTPSQGGRASRTISSPDCTGRLVYQSLEDIDLDLEDVTLWPGDTDNLVEAQLASLSMLNAVTAEPFRLVEAFGEIDFSQRGVRVREGAFRLEQTLFRGEVRVGSWGDNDAWGFFASLQTDGEGATRASAR